MQSHLLFELFLLLAEGPGALSYSPDFLDTFALRMISQMVPLGF